ncbi:MAG: OmpH family outer membrane protein [Bacteroidales bacterium]|nr:OmpH family outer membrane protein [Bacteroidales bacterium]
MKKTLLIAAMAFMTVSVFGQSFGRVNTTELVQLSPEADEARAKLQTQGQDAQQTYQDMVDEFNKKYEAYQKGVSGFSEAVRATKEKELNEINQRVQEFSANVQQELAQSEQALFQPIYQKATGIVKDLAKKYGLTLVFEEGSFPYYDEAAIKDLTPEARKSMGIQEGRTLESLQAEMQAQQQGK